MDKGGVPSIEWFVSEGIREVALSGRAVHCKG